jgi:hypothetical protein
VALIYSEVSLLEDAEAVYEALTVQSPEDAGELMRSSGIDGERLQMAIAWLELRGRVERRFNLEEVPTSSFSCVRVTEQA